MRQKLPNSSGHLPSLQHKYPIQGGSHLMAVLANTAWKMDCQLTAEGSSTSFTLPLPGKP